MLELSTRELSQNEKGDQNACSALQPIQSRVINHM